MLTCHPYQLRPTLAISGTASPFLREHSLPLASLSLGGVEIRCSETNRTQSPVSLVTLHWFKGWGLD